MPLDRFFSLNQPAGTTIPTYATIADMDTAIGAGDLAEGDVAFVTSKSTYYAACGGVAQRICAPGGVVDPVPDYGIEVDYFIPDTYLDGEKVRLWVDIGNKAIATLEDDYDTSAAFPIYRTTAATDNAPSVQFLDDRIDLFYPKILPQPLTIVIVSEYTSAISSRSLYDGVHDRCNLRIDGSDFALYAGGSIVTPTGAAFPGADGQVHMAAGIFNGASSFIRINSSKSSLVNPGTSGSDRLRIGADAGGGSGQQMYVYAAYVYERVLSDTELDDLQSFCQTKWGSV